MLNDIDLGKRLLAIKIIWIVMFISLAIYLFIGLQVVKDMQVPVDDKVIVILKPVLYILAFITLIMTGVLRKFLLSAKNLQQQTGADHQETIFQKYTAVVIASLALSESIGIYAFVLYLIGKNSMDLYVLLLVSAVAIFINRPRIDEVKSLLQRP